MRLLNVWRWFRSSQGSTPTSQCHGTLYAIPLQKLDAPSTNTLPVASSSQVRCRTSYPLYHNLFPPKGYPCPGGYGRSGMYPNAKFTKSHPGLEACVDAERKPTTSHAYRHGVPWPGGFGPWEPSLVGLQSNHNTYHISVRIIEDHAASVVPLGSIRPQISPAMWRSWPSAERVKGCKERN